MSHRCQPLPYEPGPPGSGIVQCWFCGCVPATMTAFEMLQGMIVIWRTRKVRGPFCRDCGIATFRRLTGDTLVMGWWGPFSWVLTPAIVIGNLLNRRKVAALDSPSPPESGPWRRPMAHGRPVLGRVEVLAILFVIASVAAFFGLFFVLAALDPNSYTPRY